MNTFKSFFYYEIFHSNQSNFDQLALRLFQYQAAHNAIYKSYITNLGIKVDTITKVEQIPFLPIAFFKNQEVKTGVWNHEVLFRSSGTTGQLTSSHYLRDKEFYLMNTENIFNYFYGDLQSYHFLALLPSYLDRDNSSLVMMADSFIKKSQSQYSDFYLDDYDRLLHTIRSIDDGRKILLLGVSFALLDIAEKYHPDLRGVIVMETGGMKGRRREMIKAELHEVLKGSYNVETIYSEYGMTELLSQAYSKGNGIFQSPPWMKIMLRDINDPFDVSGTRSSGGINVIDLANIDSCAFIETQDLGKMHENNQFEVMGRFDNSDVRGCNLLVL
ncbi:MAG: acyl transferase [Fulvivirga sp.]